MRVVPGAGTAVVAAGLDGDHAKLDEDSPTGGDGDDRRTPATIVPMRFPGVMWLVMALAGGAAAGEAVPTGPVGTHAVHAESPAPAADPSPDRSPLPLGRSFALDLGQSATVEGGVELAFIAVAEDSRCPLDVVCVWEGDAHVVIEARAVEAPPVASTLHSNPGFANEAFYRGMCIHLVALDPAPRTDLERPWPYRATIVVEAGPCDGSDDEVVG